MMLVAVSQLQALRPESAVKWLVMTAIENAPLHLPRTMPEPWSAEGFVAAAAAWMKEAPSSAQDTRAQAES